MLLNFRRKAEYYNDQLKTTANNALFHHVIGFQFACRYDKKSDGDIFAVWRFENLNDNHYELSGIAIKSGIPILP